MGFLRRLFHGRDLSEHLREKKTLKINGIRFVIRKIEVLDHLEGAHVLMASYDVYKTGRDQNGDKIDPTLIKSQLKKMRTHYADIILAGTEHPHLTREPQDKAGELISIDEVLRDWELADALYKAIITFSYGKKKLRQGYLQSQNSLKLT